MNTWATKTLAAVVVSLLWLLAPRPAAAVDAATAAQGIASQGTVYTSAIAGPCGTIPFQARVFDPSPPSATFNDVPTVILLAGFPESTFWFDDYAGTPIPGTATAPTPPAAGQSWTPNASDFKYWGQYSYDAASPALTMMVTLYNAGYRLIEIRWDPFVPPVGMGCAGHKNSAGIPDGFTQSYAYNASLLNLLFTASNTSVKNRYVVGHSYGASSVTALEIPNMSVKVNRSVAIAPSITDLTFGCLTALQLGSPPCAVNSSSCSYSGGWQYFFPQARTDDYNFSAAGAVNPFTYTQTQLGLAASNCHQALQTSPSLGTTLDFNSTIPQLKMQNVTNLSTSGNNILVIYGQYDFGEGAVASYTSARRSLQGPGPAPVVVPKGYHSFTDWPQQYVDMITNHILGK